MTGVVRTVTSPLKPIVRRPLHWFRTRLAYPYLPEELDRRERHLDERLDRLLGEVLDVPRQLETSMTTFFQDLEAVVARPPWSHMIGSALGRLDEHTAAVLNYANGPYGFAAQAGLWTRPAVALAHGSGTIRVSSVNAAVIVAPYAFRALAPVPVGARVLDVGGADSTVALSLASLGYRVTALAPHGYPFHHPNLTSVTESIHDWHAPGASFDAVVALSVGERHGPGEGRQDTEGEWETADADARAMARISRLAAPGARLVLSVSTGLVDEARTRRVYDLDRINELLAGWKVVECVNAHRVDEVTWTTGADGGDHPTVAITLVTAERP